MLMDNEQKTASAAKWGWPEELSVVFLSSGPPKHSLPVPQHSGGGIPSGKGTGRLAVPLVSISVWEIQEMRAGDGRASR